MNNDFIEKLIALVKNGVDGERSAALRKLKQFCEKNNIDFDSLNFDDEPVVESHDFKIPKGKDAMDLLAQIYMKVRNVGSMSYADMRRFRRGFVRSESTKQEHIEIMFMFEVYWAAFKKYKKNLMTAFILRNDIYSYVASAEESTTSPRKNKNDYDIDVISKLVRGIDTVQVHKAIENK